MKMTRFSGVAALVFLSACLLGCSDDKDVGEPGGEKSGPLYAIMYEVYGIEGSDSSNSYLSLLDSLDIDEVDPKQAREYAGGRAFVQTYDGFLYVGEATTPRVTRYSVSADAKLTETGQIDFSNYGLQEGQFDSWNVTFISPDKAYLMDFREGTTIIWNPTTMEIVGDIPAPREWVREGLSLEGSPAALRDGKLFRTFDWVDYETADYQDEFVLATYDVEKDELIDVVTETRCPVPGNLVHQDEAGNIYFSNWIWPVAGTIMHDKPESCVLRIKPGDDGFDPDWTLRYQDVTDGRHGAMFSYLEDGKALVAAFYDDRTSFDATTDPWGYVGSNNWRVWNIDVDGGTGKPVEGLDYNGGAFTPVTLDGRHFLMVPGGEEDNYATQLYELEGEKASPFVKLPGWSYQFAKLR